MFKVLTCLLSAMDIRPQDNGALDIVMSFHNDFIPNNSHNLLLTLCSFMTSWKGKYCMIALFPWGGPLDWLEHVPHVSLMWWASDCRSSWCVWGNRFRVYVVAWFLERGGPLVFRVIVFWFDFSILLPLFLFDSLKVFVPCWGVLLFWCRLFRPRF